MQALECFRFIYRLPWILSVSNTFLTEYDKQDPLEKTNNESKVLIPPYVGMNLLFLDLIFFSVT